jgi:protein TonB
MVSPVDQPKRRTPAVLLSAALHITLLATALLIGNSVRTGVVPPSAFQAMALVEVAGGAHAAALELQKMDTAAHTRKPAPTPEVTQKPILPVPQQKPKLSGGGAPKNPHAGEGSGVASHGNGADAEDARPAFPVFSPHPPVTDRALLPAGEQKIVVDVKLDALGKVVSETLVKGMGNKLDQIVLNIAWTWRFQPATLNGQPVASEAELVFPFNPSYPISD